jgi:hypothetical protein
MRAKFFSVIAISAIALVVILIFMTASCARKTDCIAKITCLDANGNPKRGVSVDLFANVRTQSNMIVKADLTAKGITDND